MAAAECHLPVIPERQSFKEGNPSISITYLMILINKSLLPPISMPTGDSNLERGEGEAL